MNTHSIAALGLLIGLGACADVLDVEVSESAILAYEGFETERSAIGAVLTDESFCTATLIAADRVLTAAHCVEDVATAEFFAGAADAGIDWSIGGSGQVLIHPEYSHPTSGYDIALVLLDEPVEGVAPIPASPHLAEEGWEVELVGYGCYDSYSGSGDGYKRFGYTEIKDVDDHRLKLKTGNARICWGDSGGPVLRTIEGTEYVLGTHSYRVMSDRTGRVDNNYDWIIGATVDSTDDAAGSSGDIPKEDSAGSDDELAGGCRTTGGGSSGMMLALLAIAFTVRRRR